MKVPLSWLRQYVDVNIPAAELAHRLTMAGVEVGEVAEIGGWSEVFVGRVTGVRPHPNADRLRLCTVTADGEAGEEMEVVCGAPNVAEGQKICFARVGAHLYNAHSGQRETLAAARIRGVESQGMICSELELGLGKDHSGIIVLPDDAPLGMPLNDYMGDTVLDLELTPNRLDCLSMLGVAHEVAALTGGTVREPEFAPQESGPPISERVSISIADPDLCRRYTASLIEGVAIGESPQWLQDRLVRAGLRPISNVVDATNFVMLEYNQPLHAFDFDRVREATVIVRRARPGEPLTTLDGETRTLGPDNLVIADAHDPIGLGGVIGGANSEIGPGTTNVLLESATFDARNNRETAQSLGLRTEATLRFEKGLRSELAPIALRRATALIQEVAGGRVAPGIVDVFPDPPESPFTVPLTARRLRQVLGMDMGLERVKAVLDSLGFSYESRDDESLIVSIPYWRNDVTIEEDLVEEVVRITGYDTVPTAMLATPIPFQTIAPSLALKDAVKDLLAASGMQEIINYPLTTLADLGRVEQLDGSSPPLRIANPMSGSHEYLRPSLQAGLLATLAANQGHDDGPVSLFEAGRVFLPRPGDLPEELETVAAAMSGQRRSPSWLEQEGPVDFYDAKGLVEWLLERLGVAAAYEPGAHPTYHPGRCAAVKAGDSVLGYVGEIHPTVRSRVGLDDAIAVGFELYLAPLLEAIPKEDRRFAPLSRYPAATRDIALLVPADVLASRITGLILRHRMVERAELFDAYSGENIAEGRKSLAFHVYFRAADRTLTNEDVDRSLDGLLRTLEREAQATLRS